MKTPHEQIRELVNVALLRSDFTLVYRLLDERPGAVVIDVGTNIGGFVDAWLNHGASVVHAFEPVPANFEKLKAAHGNNPNVVLNQMGVSDQEWVYRGVQILNGHTLAVAKDTPLEIAEEDTGPFDFKTVDMDWYVFQEPGLKRVDFIKIDVDGFEPSVLRGMRATLDKFRPPFMIELSGLPRALSENCEEMVQQIYNWNYRLCTMSGHVCEDPLLVMEAYPWRTSIDMVAVPKERIGRDWPRVR